MPRKPNYRFERNQRTKAKAAKREAKRQAKLAAKTEDNPDAADEGQDKPLPDTAEDPQA